MSKEGKLKYDQFVLNCKQEISKYTKIIEKFGQQLSSDQSINRYIVIAIITYKLKIIEILYKSNTFYHKLFQKNNETVLDNIRKNFNESTFLLKQHFTITLSPEFSKTTPYLRQLDQLTTARMFSLLSKLDTLCFKLKNLYSATSKYITTVAIIYGDICGFALSNIDFPKYLMISRDLRHSEYKTTIRLLQLVVSMMEKSADLFINAYYISENKELVRKGVQVLSTLENYFRIAGNTEELPKLARKKKSWERILSTQD